MISATEVTAAPNAPGTVPSNPRPHRSSRRGNGPPARGDFREGGGGGPRHEYDGPREGRRGGRGGNRGNRGGPAGQNLQPGPRASNVANIESAPPIPPPPGLGGGGSFGTRLTEDATKNAGEGGQVGQVGAEEEDEAEVCFICASPVVHNSVGPCNHRTCHICALRLRALYKTRACAHCRVSFQDHVQRRLRHVY